MTLTSTFRGESTGATPGAPATMTLRLSNDGARQLQVALQPTGELAEHTTVAPSSASIARNEIVDVAVTVEVPATLSPGPHPIELHATTQSAGPGPYAATSDDALADIDAGPDELTLNAVLEVGVVTACTTNLTPARSKGSSSGRHTVRVVNSGNVDVGVELTPEPGNETAEVTVSPTTITVGPGQTATTSVRVTANQTYWSGPTRDHDFAVRAVASNGHTEELEGTFVQRPRVPTWLGPALAGALLALLCGAIAWFAFLRPWVEETADDAAAEAIEDDRAALQLRIDELEEAAAEAEELPLGTATDLVLSVAPASGATEEAAEAVEPGMRLSVTDIIFQNPTGAVGTLTLRRDDQVLLQSELANFRDFDVHLVAPFVFDESEEVVLEVDCRTAGAGESDCPVSATVLGFVDETG